MMLHTYNPSTLEPEAGEFEVLNQTRLCSRICLKETKRTVRFKGLKGVPHNGSMAHEQRMLGGPAEQTLMGLHGSQEALRWHHALNARKASAGL